MEYNVVILPPQVDAAIGSYAKRAILTCRLSQTPPLSEGAMILLSGEEAGSLQPCP